MRGGDGKEWGRGETVSKNNGGERAGLNCMIV
jgi:hypothetical protein